ncbi:hypothetical protein IEQ34_013844 [Dendrobium chrysotoxum]|uniref:Uncharacterized protein n=1 Tax=Dendrobium chrysotoxum TaxID=161865 RepID=A0AAV7GS40_DENCH|nr:hypothetical protein IEQ34_013844 [Dendrobium chrysotoxum]
MRCQAIHFRREFQYLKLLRRSDPDGVKVVEKNILHTTKKLAEKVLVNCSLKIKPYLAKLFNGNGATISNYSKIVTDVFQVNSDTSINNEMNASGENQEANNKLSEQFLSDDSSGIYTARR